MDLIKTGTFIATERKRKKYTQKQLATLLSISDRTISKWECGKGFPEVSLLIPLCDALDISVNELLNGERLSEADYHEKAEKAMLDMVKERDANKEKLILLALLGFISTLSFVILLLIGIHSAPLLSQPLKIVLFCVACIIFMVGFVVMLRGGRTYGYYQCLRCNKTFTPTPGKYLISPNLISRRYLICPNCLKHNWCKKVLIKKESANCEKP